MEKIEIEITPNRVQTNEDEKWQYYIERSLIIAMDAHVKERDRDGNVMLLHPIIVGSMGKTPAEKCVGFLHDVVEDTDWTFSDLKNEGLPKVVIDALKLLTHNKNMTYKEYVQRIIDSKNMLAINVKLNDLHHNIARGKAFGYKELVEKHTGALKMIEEEIPILKVNE